MQRERASANDSIQSTDHDTKRPRVDDESTALEAGMWRCRMCGWKNRTENEICGGMGGSKAAAGGKKYGCGAPRMLSYTLDPSPIDVMPQQQQPSAASVDATLRTLGGLARSQQRDHELPLSSLLANDACIQPFAAGTQQKFSLSPLSAVPCGAVVPAAGAPGDEVAAAWAETSTPPPQPAERLEGTYEI